LQPSIASHQQGSALLHEQVELLKKKTQAAEESLARTQMQFEELKKQQADANAILIKILSHDSAGNCLQP